ncbi:NAD-dependent DNA ligase LigA [Blattabacterium cuenoti]|uniref:NAD-dependent DNA ligase LigA n=1 Tax=Blattabacterium cuenoti TaxID=1653831 RepID=UPI00163C4B36|nr:NAD-dependent DNA ligase LigA [Blattabacterium cuenoti]
MDHHNIKKKIHKLRKELSEYNYQYYMMDHSEISDYDFDQKLKKLFFLEKKYPEFYDPTSPTLRIGVDNTSYNDPIHHQYKMYSLKNTYSKKEFIIWKKRIKKYISSFSLICELKYDGVSINLIYKNGFLTHAGTRGDGIKGENVTENVRTIPSIPLQLRGNKYPPYLEIRGEIFLSKKNFIYINKKRIKSGKNPYSHPRNTASGTLKMKNTQEVYKRSLSCIVYTVIGNHLPFHTQNKSFQYLQNWGFKVPKKFILGFKNKDIFQYIDYWNKWKHLLSYHIDGIVIKVNEYKNQSILGYTNKYPRWAIAYKFKQKLSETNLLKLKFQVGRTGIITPVAHVRPIKISGTKIKKVALYNDHFIQKMGIHYGDTLLLEKGGNIIPKVTKVNVKKRLKNAYPINFLKKCPSCDHLLTKNKKFFFCKNKNCPSQKRKKIQHFVSEKAMNIKGIGKKMIKKLYQKGYLSEITDLYKLKSEDFIKIYGVKKKLTDVLLKNIEKSKYNSYHRLIYALGIPHVGEYISKKLTEHFVNIHFLISASYDHLTSILGIGKKIAESIKTYFSIDKNKNLVEKIIQYGVNFTQYPINKKFYPLEGKSFVFTGKLSHMTRNIAKNKVESLGGRVFNTVNNKIHFIVVGKNFGSKLEKCMKKKNIKILNEDIFMKIIEHKKKEK